MSAGNSFLWETCGPNVFRGEYHDSFPIDLMCKDTQLGYEMARDAKVSLSCPEVLLYVIGLLTCIITFVRTSSVSYYQLYIDSYFSCYCQPKHTMMLIFILKYGIRIPYSGSPGDVRTDAADLSQSSVQFGSRRRLLCSSKAAGK